MKTKLKPKGNKMTMEEFANYVVSQRKPAQVLLDVDMLDSGAAVVNVGDEGGYVMVELTPVGILVTVFNDAGDVLSEKEYNLKGK